MKSVSVNRTTAISILMGAVLYYTDNSLKVKESEKKGTDFAKAYEDATEKDMSSSYAVGLLEGDSEKGRHLELGILALHHDTESFESKQELKAIFDGDKQAIQRAVDAGRIVERYRQSPAFSGEFGVDESPEIVTEEKVDGDITDTSSLGLNNGGDQVDNVEEGGTQLDIANAVPNDSEKKA